MAQKLGIISFPPRSIIFALIVSAHAQNLQEQILDDRLTVRVPGPMVEMRVGVWNDEESKRLWAYQKDDVTFVVIETRYKPSVKPPKNPPMTEAAGAAELPELQEILRDKGVFIPSGKPISQRNDTELKSDMLTRSAKYQADAARNQVNPQTGVALDANPLMKLMIRSSIVIDSPGIQDTGTYQGISFTGKNGGTIDVSTITILVSGQTEWLLLSTCKTAQSWKLTHSLPLYISFK
jgi:hypothetical protein